MRIAFGVEYEGSHFIGWQRQDNGPSIQAHVEAALSKIAAHPVQVICAGRTDAGVHSVGQVIHADVQVERPVRAWVLGTNTHLPPAISILWAKPVDDNFHARFSAQARHYRYVTLNRLTRPAVLHRKVAWIYQPLNVELMQTGANFLLGEHDFSAYRGAGCQSKSPVRIVQHITVTRHEDFIVLAVCADAFLYHMVRNIAGVLIAIGAGQQPPQWAQQVLQSRDRRQGGITAPAEGLYLYDVDYPPAYTLPKSPASSWPFPLLTN